MKAQLTATVVDGDLKLDQPVELPNNTRVSIILQAVSIAGPDAAKPAGWEAMKRRIRERPIHAGGLHFNRDELHERR